MDQNIHLADRVPFGRGRQRTNANVAGRNIDNLLQIGDIEMRVITRIGVEIGALTMKANLRIRPASAN